MFICLGHFLSEKYCLSSLKRAIKIIQLIPNHGHCRNAMYTRGVITLLAIYKIPKSKIVFAQMSHYPTFDGIGCLKKLGVLNFGLKKRG